MFHLYHGIHFVHDFSSLTDARKMITWLCRSDVRAATPSEFGIRVSGKFLADRG